MEIPFKTKIVEGKTSIMPVDDLKISEIRVNQITKDIVLVVEVEDKYTFEDLDGLAWQEIKKLIIENNGEWESKAKGIEYLIGRLK